jgi:hypothetical protein
MIRRILRVLPLLALVGLLAFRVTPLHHARASSGVTLAISPAVGAADQSRLFEFDGFNASDPVQFTFTDPTGQSVTVKGYPTFDASAQADGTGAFFFKPSAWLDSLLPGMWTVTITSPQTGWTATATMMILP